MKLGTQVGLGLGLVTVLDVNPAAALPKKAQPPIFGPRPLWPNGWMN